MLAQISVRMILRASRVKMLPPVARPAWCRLPVATGTAAREGRQPTARVVEQAGSAAGYGNHPLHHRGPGTARHEVSSSPPPGCARLPTSARTGAGRVKVSRRVERVGWAEGRGQGAGLGSGRPLRPSASMGTPPCPQTSRCIAVAAGRLRRGRRRGSGYIPVCAARSTSHGLLVNGGLGCATWHRVLIPRR